MTSTSPLADVAAVLIHHRNFPDVLGTVDAVLAAGIRPRSLVVVDNSEDEAILSQLSASTPSDVRVIAVANQGYGHAANLGVAAAVSQLDAPPAFVLIATHETRPRADAIGILRDALVAQSELGVVGPTLLTRRDGEMVTWSQGGTFAGRLGTPEHFGYLGPVVDWSGVGITPRDYVDGAFCLYRRDVFESLGGIREDFFLYFEESEFHARIRSAGYVVGWVPEAVVEQGSGGIPPYLLTRNLQKYLRSHGTRLQRFATVPYMVTRRSLRKTLRGGPDRERRDMLRGWWHGVR